MKQQKTVFAIEQVETLFNSYVGNPRYKLYLRNVLDGSIRVAKTKTNGAVGYRLGTWSEGKTLTLTYHYTKNGNMIVDDCD